MGKVINIIGGGASALILACELDPAYFEVHLYEKNKKLGRKFLVAGDGGFNLTHSEDPASFIQRYTSSDFLKEAFHYFSNGDLRVWLEKLGIETFVGSSGRVFPKKGIKPVEVLNALLKRMKSQGVVVHHEHEWKGFAEDGSLVFQNKTGRVVVESHINVFCLGGATWPVTGSAGEWPVYFENRKVRVNTFEASNCAFEIKWAQELIEKLEGRALKNCVFSCGGKSQVGEAVLTRFGIEGSGVYALSPQIRAQLHKQGKASLQVDMKPGFTISKISDRLSEKEGNRSRSTLLKEELNLSVAQVQLLKNFLSKEDFMQPKLLATAIKNLQLQLIGTGPLETAISSVGGIDLNEIDRNFKLIKFDQTFVIGEMLDYDAPTGGYLLQSCFSMAAF